MSVERLKQARDHLRDWLAASRVVASAAPEAQKLEEQLSWEVRTLEGVPPGAPNYLTTGLDERAEDLLHRVTTLFPALPQIDLGAITSVNSGTTSTASTMVTYLAEVGQTGTPANIAFASEALREYQEIQDRQQRPEDVRRLLREKYPSLLARFDAAAAAYDRYRSGHTDAAAVAISARNFVDGLKGELIDQARAMPTESISLDTAVTRLFAASPTVQDVEYEMRTRGDLISSLSEIAKGRRPATRLDIDALWLRVLGHALVTLMGLP
jgi:hypothetical protein